MTNQTNDQERLVTITEQGNFGLGIGEVTNEDEKKALRKRLDEMMKKPDQLRNSK